MTLDTGFLLSPLVTAVYPLLTRLYEDKSNDEVLKLSRYIFLNKKSIKKVKVGTITARSYLDFFYTFVLLWLQHLFSTP